MHRDSRYRVFDTDGGPCGIAWTALGVQRFQLPADDATTTRHLLLRHLSGAVAADPPPTVAQAVDGVRLYFAGETIDFSDVVLDLHGQSDFCRAVYEVTRRVPWGETTTYGALAGKLGAGPEAARAIGQAMAKNPVALIIPCHRVLAAGARLGGFSAPGGTTSKLRMLALEGIAKAPAPPAQQSFGF